MKAFAYIFARGGSKGLPQKNVRLLGGKPLLQHSIDVALESHAFDMVFVSTDDDEIASIGSSAGAHIIKRPQELACDHSPEWLAWRHAIEWTRKHHGEFDLFVSLPATSPLRSVDDVLGAIGKLQHSGADVCISVTPSSRSPYFNMVKLTADGFCELVNKCPEGPIRRQDAPPVFDITTVVYAANPNFIMTSSGLFEGNVVTIEVPKERAVDIDDIHDFLFAEAIFNAKAPNLC